MDIIKTLLLFILTAFCEILGCYLPYLWLVKNKSMWLVCPALLSLSVFVWLLTLHPEATGRVYAAYGGVYIAVAILWLWLVQGIKPNIWDITGCITVLIGMSIIIIGAKYHP